MRVHLSFDAPDGMTEEEILSFLIDAVYEYETSSGPTALDAVNRRFPLGSFSRPFRETKIAEITQRRALASKLNKAIRETRKVEIETSIVTAVREYADGEWSDIKSSVDKMQDCVEKMEAINETNDVK